MDYSEQGNSELSQYEKQEQRKLLKWSFVEAMEFRNALQIVLQVFEKGTIKEKQIVKEKICKTVSPSDPAMLYRRSRRLGTRSDYDLVDGSSRLFEREDYETLSAAKSDEPYVVYSGELIYGGRNIEAEVTDTELDIMQMQILEDPEVYEKRWNNAQIIVSSYIAQLMKRKRTPAATDDLVLGQLPPDNEPVNANKSKKGDGDMELEDLKEIAEIFKHYASAELDVAKETGTMERTKRRSDFLKETALNGLKRYASVHNLPFTGLLDSIQHFKRDLETDSRDVSISGQTIEFGQIPVDVRKARERMMRAQRLRDIQQTYKREVSVTNEPRAANQEIPIPEGLFEDHRRSSINSNVHFCEGSYIENGSGSMNQASFDREGAFIDSPGSVKEYATIHREASQDDGATGENQSAQVPKEASVNKGILNPGALSFIPLSARNRGQTSEKRMEKDGGMSQKPQQHVQVSEKASFDEKSLSLGPPEFNSEPQAKGNKSSRRSLENSKPRERDAQPIKAFAGNQSSLANRIGPAFDKDFVGKETELNDLERFANNSRLPNSDPLEEFLVVTKNKEPGRQIINKQRKKARYMAELDSNKQCSQATEGYTSNEQSIANQDELVPEAAFAGKQTKSNKLVGSSTPPKPGLSDSVLSTTQTSNPDQQEKSWETPKNHLNIRLPRPAPPGNGSNSYNPFDLLAEASTNNESDEESPSTPDEEEVTMSYESSPESSGTPGTEGTSVDNELDKENLSILGTEDISLDSELGKESLNTPFTRSIAMKLEAILNNSEGPASSSQAHASPSDFVPPAIKTEGLAQQKKQKKRKRKHKKRKSKHETKVSREASIDNGSNSMVSATSPPGSAALGNSGTASMSSQVTTTEPGNVPASCQNEEALILGKLGKTKKAPAKAKAIISREFSFKLVKEKDESTAIIMTLENVDVLSDGTLSSEGTMPLESGWETDGDDEGFATPNPTDANEDDREPTPEEEERLDLLEKELKAMLETERRFEEVNAALQLLRLQSEEVRFARI